MGTLGAMGMLCLGALWLPFLHQAPKQSVPVAPWHPGSSGWLVTFFHVEADIGEQGGKQ